MDKSTSINEPIWNQFGASIDMLENAIKMCPDQHWDTSLNFGVLLTIAYFGLIIT